MDDKIYIMTEERYKQIEIEVEQMDEDKTVMFLVPENEASKLVSELEELLYACHYTVPEVMTEMKEAGKCVHYMCTLYDDRIEHEYTPNREKNVSKELSVDEKIAGAKERCFFEKESAKDVKKEAIVH